MRRLASLVAASALLSLAGCSGSTTPAPVASQTAVNHAEQATIDGEWVFTRTVTKSDDTVDPAKKIGTVTQRYTLFSDVNCLGGPCTGTVQSGPSLGARDSSTFTSAGNVITYDFVGTLNCLNPADGSVLVQDGFSFRSHVELKPPASQVSPGSRAADLTGTLTYTDTVTNAALGAGCTRDPVTATTEYSLVGVRADAVPINPTSIPSPSPSH